MRTVLSGNNFTALVYKIRGYIPIWLEDHWGDLYITRIKRGETYTYVYPVTKVGKLHLNKDHTVSGLNYIEYWAYWYRRKPYRRPAIRKAKPTLNQQKLNPYGALTSSQMQQALAQVLGQSQKISSPKTEQQFIDDLNNKAREAMK